MISRRLTNSQALFVALVSLLVGLPEDGAIAGSIPVNTSQDELNSADTTITLREALMFANGTRVPGTIGDPSEQDQIAPPFGPGVVDTIQVQNFGDIVLQTPLPPLSDAGDSLNASSLLVLSGAQLPTNSGPAFHLTTNDHEILGFTISDFKQGAFQIESADNHINGTFILRCETAPLVVSGAGATGNTIEHCVIRDSTPAGAPGLTFNDQSTGIYVRNGASGNTFQNCHIYGNDGHGVHVTGTGTTGNFFIQLNIGISEPPDNILAGNLGFGILVDGVATANVFGDPANDSAFSWVTDNAMGGIYVTGAGTDENIFHSLAIGKSKNSTADYVWVGNGSGPGFRVDGGAKDNKIGKAGVNTPIVVGGHASHAYVFSGVGTTGNNLLRAYAGESPFAGVPSESRVIPNSGHGVWVTDGAGNMRIGGSDHEFSQIEMEGVGGHGIFLDGNNAGTPISNILVGAYHMGDSRSLTPEVPSIAGHGVLMMGKVDTVTLGLAGHRNTTCGAAGYGVVITGPDVKNVDLIHVFTTEGTQGHSPNDLGGLLIGDGAGPVTVSSAAEDEQCWFSGNGSVTIDPRATNLAPGIRIDASNPERLPHDIRIHHTKVGPLFFPTGTFLNTGAGIEIYGPAAGDPVALTNVEIGPRSVISGNLQDGIVLRNVKGVRIFGNEIGIDETGLAPLPNEKNGIVLDHAEGNIIGDPADPQNANVISGNKAAGILIKNGSHSNTIQGNLIGLLRSGDAAADNASGIQFTQPGPPDGTFQVIGGSSPRVTPAGGALGEGNVISGNGDGILLATGGQGQLIQNVKIQGNLIGTNLEGSSDVANTQNGIELFNFGIGKILVGDRNDPSRGNVISGNAQSGIRIEGIEDFEIYNNAIGTNAARNLAIANGEDGVSLKDVQNGRVGTISAPHAGNVISGNTSAGVRVENEVGTDQLRISHNMIGTNLDGNAAVPNAFGVVVEQTEAPPLIIGGINQAIANETTGELNQGNLISGNLQHGIFFVDAGVVPLGIGIAVVTGNIIGLSLDGSARIPNEKSGIELTGVKVRNVTIGSPGDDNLANVISGNGQDGIHVAGQSSQGAAAYRNRIGTGVVKTVELGNERHGIFIEEDSMDCNIVENTINYNKENGIKISGAACKDIELAGNSMHRNFREGIKLEGGANNGVEPPKLYVDFRNGTIDVKTEPGARVDIFADPTTTLEGYWGQGKKFIESATASGTGFARLNFNQAPEGGIITMTATLEKNTSEFTPFMVGAITQSVDGNKPDLLVAGKRTVFQMRANTGVRGPSRQVTGELTIGSQVLTRDASLKNREQFISQHSLRMKGEDGLAIDMGKPAAGGVAASFLLKSNGFEVGKLDLGTVQFQATRPFSLVGYKVEAPTTPGGTDKKSPSEALMLSAIEYMANAYPVEPDEIKRRYRLSPVTIALTQPPHGEDHWREMNTETLRRLNLERADGESGEIGLSFVSSEVRFAPASNTKQINGFRFAGSSKQIVGVLDRLPTGEGAGGVLAHELGHFFGLPDTYTPEPRDANGVLTTPPQPPIPHSSFGIRIEEDDFGYSPEGMTVAKDFGVPGPVFSFGDGGSSIHDFMGSATFSWAEPRAYRFLFTKLGGSADREAPTARAPGVSTAMIVYLELSDDGTVEIDSTDRIGFPVLRPPTGAFGDILTVELRGSVGNLIDSQTVGTNLVVEELGTDTTTGSYASYADAAGAPMSVVLQDHPDADMIEVKRGVDVLDSITRSANGPGISFTAPLSPDLPAGLTTISWTATDPDGDPLVIDILYSPDGGATRYPVDVGLRTETSIEVDLSRVPTGSSPILLARASDGFNITEVTSGTTYNIPDREPSVEIINPDSLDTIDVGFPFAFEAASWDPEDGALFDASMTWTINGNPTIVGTGMHPVIELAEGTTVVRVTVMDSFGHSVFDEVTITIAELPPPFDQIAAFVAGIVDNLEGSDRNTDLLTDTGDVREAIEVDK